MFALSVYQVLKCANEWSAQTPLVQVFSIAQVDNLVNQLQNKKNKLKKEYISDEQSNRAGCEWEGDGS